MSFLRAGLNPVPPLVEWRVMEVIPIELSLLLIRQTVVFSLFLL
jgi:hypothetical protein